MKNLQYPIGEFEASSMISKARVNALIVDLELLPTQLRKAVSTLSDEQRDLIRSLSEDLPA